MAFLVLVSIKQPFPRIASCTYYSLLSYSLFHNHLLFFFSQTFSFFLLSKVLVFVSKLPRSYINALKFESVITIELNRKQSEAKRSVYKRNTMALRVFYPTPRCVRTHPYWDTDDEFFFYPIRFKEISSRRNKLEKEWNRFLSELFQLEKPEETKTDKPADGTFSVDFELSGFEPKHIKVKTVGQKLIVEATKEENDEKDGLKSYSKRHFHKSLVLPDTVKPDDVTSSLTEKGVLRITAPVMSLPAPEEKEREIEVAKEKTEDDNDETSTAEKTDSE